MCSTRTVDALTRICIRLKFDIIICQNFIAKTHHRIKAPTKRTIEFYFCVFLFVFFFAIMIGTQHYFSKWMGQTMPARSHQQCDLCFHNLFILSEQPSITSYTYRTHTPIPAWWSYKGRCSSPVCRDYRPHSYLPGSPSWAVQCASVCKSSVVL